MNDEVIEQWFLLYEKDITSFLVYYTGSLDVEDIVQDTFIKAIKKYNTFKNQSHPKTWLISIARNIVNDRYRRQQIWGRLYHLFKLPTDLRNEIEQQTVDKEIIDELYEAIHQLTKQNKEIIILRGIMELSAKEVAKIINTNENHVHVLYHRALKTLKSILGEERGEYYGKFGG